MNEKYLEAGKIVSTHGVRGEVKVLPWADSPEFLTKFKTFYLVGTSIACPTAVEKTAAKDDTPPHPSSGFRETPDATFPPRGRLGGRSMSAPTALAVESSRVQNTCVLIKFRGVDTVEQAQRLREQVLRIARDDPHIPAGTVFQADLIGMPVRAAGEEIGRIAEILTMPASDVWVVRGEKEYMIPNVRAFVPVIDLSLGYVDVNLIEGMETDTE